MPNNRTGNAIINYAKIQSHNQAHTNINEHIHIDMNMHISAHIPIIKAKTLLMPQHYGNIGHGAVASLGTQINVKTPTQRYQGSPEHNILFSGPQSITEFMPLTDESKTNSNTNVTPMSQTDHSISNRNIAFKPANKTGSIPVINKYRKPHKIMGF
eukprot:UN01527